MNSILEQAKKLLINHAYTCVILSGTEQYSSTQRGIAPLMQWIAEEHELKDSIAADKVVGKAAAYLYVLMEVKALYAMVISEPALEVLKRNHVFVVYDTVVPAIRNRNNTGFCPMETAVLEIGNAKEAYDVLKIKLEELKQS